jgi:hypothetical protein
MCSPASYAAAGGLMPCVECPPFRNTTSSTSAPFSDSLAAMPLPAGTGTDQDAITDCKVIAGHGVIGNTSVVSSLSLAQQVALDIGECRVGFYSTGGQVGSVCIPCSHGAAGGMGPYSTTVTVGSTNVTDCNGECLKLPSAAITPALHIASCSSFLGTYCLYWEMQYRDCCKSIHITIASALILAPVHLAFDNHAWTNHTGHLAISDRFLWSLGNQ